MSRDNYNYGSGTMSNNHKQNQMIRDAAKAIGISEAELSAEVHARKEDWYAGDFSYSELLDIAREIKNKKK